MSFPHPGRLRLAALALSVLLGGFGVIAHADPALSVKPQTPGLTRIAEFPPVKLRGYGIVSGTSWGAAEGGSLLEIDCQDAVHARLLQAKYLSDLGELPPAVQSGTISAGGAEISIHTVQNAGAVTALRAGATVVLATAPSPDALGRLITADIQGTPSQWTSTAEGTVPMYLDRFDKYGFRFYYAPDELPPGPDGRHGDPTYNVDNDFKWMQSQHTGLLVWQNGEGGITPEWLTNDPKWRWTLSEAQAKGLPFGINLGLAPAVYWYFNRNPHGMMQFVPDFLGGYYGSMNFGIGPIASWSSPVAQNMLLAQIEQTVTRLKDVDNITSWLEPHEELGGGAADRFVDYGPQADTTFREYLRKTYGSLGAVARRYHTTLASWDKIHVPEPADFLGWGRDAVDLTGIWKVSFADADNPPAMAPAFDDSPWGQIEAPGDGLARSLPQRPALWRRHFSLNADWRTRHPAIYLYVWDMNDTRAGRQYPGARVVVSLNGQILPEMGSPCFTQEHWAAYNVTATVRKGDNLLAVRLPRGLFNYRVYLSGEAPKSYPDLGPAKNALWADFVDWLGWSRERGVARGMQMIRQADPNRGIMLMAPDSYADRMLVDAISYGGDFHNTGYMAGWWCDRLPALMRGAGLPMSAEPGAGPTLPIHMLTWMGNWITEGVNGIDLFQRLGEVLYHPELKKTFEDHDTLYTSIGRYHPPVAQIAVLYSNRVEYLLGFPFNAHPARDHGQPYFRGGGFVSQFDIRKAFSPVELNPAGPNYESDAVTEQSFIHDQVDPTKYRVVLDTDTAILSEAAIDGIERYVRAGGTFVTYGDTGRHSDEVPDSWPIQRLTGFQVTSIAPTPGTISLDPGQDVLPKGADLTAKVQGLHLKASVPDAKPVIDWNDGTTAVGIRPLGKGFVMDIGIGPWGEPMSSGAFFTGLFDWLKISPVPATMQGDGQFVYWRHLISNNGLYDLWVVRNRSSDTPQRGTIVLSDNLRPPWMVDLNTGARTTVTDGRLPFTLPAAETQIMITPRAALAASTSDWFTLQRGWWQGSAPTGAPFPKRDMKFAYDLEDGWALQAVNPQQSDVSNLIKATIDDHTWPKVSLGIFSLPDRPELRHAVIRREIEVPAAWNHGEVQLHLPDFRRASTAYLDGEPMRPPVFLSAGTAHSLAIDIRSTDDILGATGPAWLSYHPDPPSKQDLSAMWQTSTDFLHWSGMVRAPGEIARGTRALRASFVVDRAAEGKTIVFRATQRSYEVKGIVINGHGVGFSDPGVNITPWVRPGQNNTIVLEMGGSHETIFTLSLEFYPPGTYP